MSTGAIVAIIVLIVVIAALLAGLAVAGRRRRLQERFGPEYERAVRQHDSRRQAEAELTGRERRVRELNIRPLPPTARAQYSSEWTGVQEQFVEAPQAAVTGAQKLLIAVMRDRGYPTENYDQELADLSVEHAATLDHFRAAHEISQRATTGSASTEDLRQAMIHYRTLFTELLGQPARGDGTSPYGRTVQDQAATTASGDGAAGPRLADQDGIPAGYADQGRAAGLEEDRAAAAGRQASTTSPDRGPADADPVTAPRREG